MNTSKSKTNFILASGSPRRIEMMKENGYDPLIFPADIEENIPLNHDMQETVMFLALKKAQHVRGRLLRAGNLDISDEKSVIIAADTIVYHDGEIMGKPSDPDDGFRMLSGLRRTYHYVVTGVAMIDMTSGAGKVFSEVTKVWFKDYSDDELKAYLMTDEAYDKAGGYAIQGYFSRYVEKFEGDYDNVVGFPWKRISFELEKL